MRKEATLGIASFDRQKSRAFLTIRGLHPKRISVFFEKLSTLLGCNVRFPMRMSPEIAIPILFRRCGGETLRGFFIGLEVY